MDEKISIIVPVYNVENYLDKCLESIVNQLYKELEIILIDDGSKDKSYLICKKWEKKDCRIKVIHQSNRGVSAARNVGLEIATGNYIAFVDPDDIISRDMFSSMIKNMQDNGADIVACGVAERFLNQEERIYKKGENPIKLNKKESINRALMLSDDIGGVVWDKLWKRDVIKNIRFDEELAIAEDRLFVIAALINSNIFYRDFEPKYYCIKREESATQSKFSKKSFDIVWSAKKVYMKILNFSNEYLKEANFHISMACMNIINLILKNNEIENYKVEYRKVVKLLNNIEINELPDEVSSILRVKIRILKRYPKLYLLMWKVKNFKFV